MGIALNPGVSFCLVGGRAVFLDRRTGRYRALNRPQTRALLTGQPVQALLDAGLATALAAAPPPTPCRALAASRDLPDGKAGAPGLLDLVQTALATLLARLALASGRLERLLTWLDRRQARSRSPRDTAAAKAQVQAARFNRARPWSPVAAVCLVDSLALMLFLTWRGCAATLVFGVALPPFTAHAWVQSGDCVLNDAVERIVVYTPILAVGP